jgi:hypothetical protein
VTVVDKTLSFVDVSKFKSLHGFKGVEDKDVEKKASAVSSLAVKHKPVDKHAVSVEEDDANSMGGFNEWLPDEEDPNYYIPAELFPPVTPGVKPKSVVTSSTSDPSSAEGVQSTSHEMGKRGL